MSAATREHCHGRSRLGVVICQRPTWLPRLCAGELSSLDAWTRETVCARRTAYETESLWNKSLRLAGLRFTAARDRPGEGEESADRSNARGFYVQRHSLSSADAG